MALIIAIRIPAVIVMMISVANPRSSSDFALRQSCVSHCSPRDYDRKSDVSVTAPTFSKGSPLWFHPSKPSQLGCIYCGDILLATGSFGNITKNCSQHIDISRDFAHFGISFLVKSSRPSWRQNPPRPSPETVSREPFCCCGNTLCICGDRKKDPATIGLTKSVFQLVFVLRNL